MTAPIHNSSPLPPLGGVAQRPPARPAPAEGAGGASFAEQLRRSAGGIEFSKHAVERLERRGIAADPATLRRLESGIERAAAKGAREAVVLIDHSAFVVSVRNRTVITAIDSTQMRDHVFTNIDSAAIA